MNTINYNGPGTFAGISGTISITITPQATGTLSLLVNGDTTPAPIPSGDNIWVAVKGLNYSLGNYFIDLSDANNVEIYGSRQNQITSANSDWVIPLSIVSQGVTSPLTPGVYKARLEIEGGGTVASVSFQVIEAIPQMFPFLNTTQGSATFSPSITTGNILASTPSGIVVVKGTVTIDHGLMTDSGLPLPTGLVVQYMINDQPLGPQIPQSGNGPIQLIFDTTTKPDGTYVLGAKIIDCLDTSGNWPAYTICVLPLNFIIMNVGPIPETTSQTIPVFYQYKDLRAQPTTLDYVKYKGVPQPSNTPPYPGAGQSVQFVPPVFSTNSPYHTDPTQTRSSIKHYFDKPNELMGFEYQSQNQFRATRVGGVAMVGWSAKQGGGLSIESAYSTIVRSSYLDGSRGNNMISPFSNIIATPLNGPFDDPIAHHWTVVQLNGRIFLQGLNGQVKTIVGPKRDTTHLPLDDTDSNNAEFASNVIIGTPPPGTDFGGMNDCCWDPRNPYILYATKTFDDWIMKIDFTSQTINGINYGVGNPYCTIYAGQDGNPGYVDGPAASAKFNGPYSICMQKIPGIPGHPVGTMYVADNYNCLIRIISDNGSTVNTLCGAHAGITPPADAIQNKNNSTFVHTVTTNPDAYSSPTPVSFSNAYTAYPQTLKLSSTGDIILGEAYYNQMIRRIWLSGTNAGMITRIGNFGNNLNGGHDLGFGWHDVDDVGACGEVDDIVLFKTDTDGAAEWMWRLSIDGKYSARFYGDQVAFYAEGIGWGGHYPWNFAFSKTQFRMLSTGLADFGFYSWRAPMPGDPTLEITGSNQDGGPISCWRLGTAPIFPFGVRPSFMSLYGQAGSHHLGSNVLPTLDELWELYPTDVELAAFIQAGAGGTVPRPEFSFMDDGITFSRDLADIVYFFRRQSLQGTYPATYKYPTNISYDFIRPNVSNVTAVRVSNTSIQVTWKTDKPTLGLAAAGSPHQQNLYYPYNIPSPLEADYSTDHSVMITGLPDLSVPGNGPTHYAVLSKDKAGNWGRSSDMIIS